MGLTTILIVITVFSSLAIIVLALMQTSKGDMGSAFGGGGSQSMFGSRGSANFLSRTTSVMVTVFFISSLALAYLYAQRNEANSVVDQSVLELQPAVESEVPMLEDEPVVDPQSELPQIESEEGSGPQEVPTTPEEAPATEGSSSN